MRIGIFLYHTGTVDSGPVWGDEVMALGFQRHMKKTAGVEFVKLYNRDQIELARKDELDLGFYFHPDIDKAAKVNIFWLQNGQNEQAAIRSARNFEGVAFCSKVLLKEYGSGIYLPQTVDTGIYYKKDSVKELECDITYVGNNIKEQETVKTYLEPLVNQTKYKLSIYGNSWPYPQFRGRISPFIVPDLYSSSKIVLSMHLKDHKRYDVVTSRVYEALACETLVISDVIEEAVINFHQHVVFSAGAEHLLEQVEFYLTNESARLEMIKGQRQLIVDKYDVRHRVNDILNYYDKLVKK